MDKNLDDKALHAKGGSLSAGFLAGMSDKEITEKGHKFGDAVGVSIVTGAAGAVKLGLVETAVAAKALALKTGAAVVAAPTTPWILGGGAIATLLGYGYNIECQKEYGHCLRSHFDSPSVNEEKMPRRCESPERRAFRWGTSWAGQQKRIFKILKEERRRPRPALPGSQYWSNEGPNVMGKDDLDNK